MGSQALGWRRRQNFAARRRPPRAIHKADVGCRKRTIVNRPLAHVMASTSWSTYHITGRGHLHAGRGHFRSVRRQVTSQWGGRWPAGPWGSLAMDPGRPAVCVRRTGLPFRARASRRGTGFRASRQATGCMPPRMSLREDLGVYSRATEHGSLSDKRAHVGWPRRASGD